MSDHTFPFGSTASPRPPRSPNGPAALFVLGVYPSALHVHWTPPAWAMNELGVTEIGALAVADEPTVFWDGLDPNAEELVASWKQEVGFRDGDGQGDWGSVHSAGNGTSGRPVTERILNPLGISPKDTWFSDAVNTYFVKNGTGSQGEAWKRRYRPFAERSGLPSGDLPTRPSPQILVRTAVEEHSGRLRAELLEAAAPVVITLGEEARQVLAAIVDARSGPPTEPLRHGANYGKPGAVSVGEWNAEWLALVHPGQRSTEWTATHNTWITERTTG